MKENDKITNKVTWTQEEIKEPKYTTIIYAK